MDGWQRVFRSPLLYPWLVCIALTTYAVLRAWLVAPLHDENATFYHFIETGAIWGEGSLLDANNHLLNSYIGRFFYTTFGEHYFLFRLPSALSIAGYFWAIWMLTSSFKNQWQRWSVTLSIVCVPFAFDYFSYTRGYGLALFFFSVALYFLQRWLQVLQNRFLLLLIICLILSVTSNLTFLVSALLIMCYVLMYTIIRLKSFSVKKGLLMILLSVGFYSGLKPLLDFSFELRDANALYYGSLDGFWLVTGKTLCRYVLFYDADWLKWFIVVVALLIAFLVIRLLKQYPLKAFLVRPEAWGTFLIVGNMTSILFLAKVLHINYPEDRAAMYFIPLVLLVFGAVIGQFNRWKWLLIALLFFPFTFILQLNLSTSVFTPDQRMSQSFYEQVRNHLRSTDKLCVDPIQQLNWAHFERVYQSHPHFAVADRTFEGAYDVFISNDVFPFPKEKKALYSVIAYDSQNGVIAYRKKRSTSHSARYVHFCPMYHGRDEFILLHQDTNANNRLEKPFILDILGTITIDSCYKDLQLVIDTERSNGEIIRKHSFNFRWYFGEKRQQFSFHFPYTRLPLSKDEQKLKVYIWNPEKRLVTLSNRKTNDSNYLR